MSKRSGSVSWMLLLLVTGLSLAAAWLPRLPLRAGTTLAAEEEAMRAQYAAESGAVRALEELKRSGTIDPAGYTWELDGAAVRVTGTKDGKEYRIRTEGESARKHVLSRLLLTCVVEKKDKVSGGGEGYTMPSGQRIKDVYAKIRKEWKKRRDQYVRSRPEEVMAITGRHVLLARVREGKFLASHHYIMEGNSLEKELPEVLRKAERDGYTARHITLILNGADSPVRTRRFPRMTEDELEETVYWEEDRLFGTVPHSADYRILSSSPEGYDILAAGVREETMARLTGLLKEAGKTLDRVVPAVETAVPEEDIPWAFLLGSREQGLLAMGRGPGAVEVRRVRKKENRESAEAWIRRVEKRMGSPEKLCFLPAWEGTDRAGWEDAFPFLPWEKKPGGFPEEQADYVPLLSAMARLSACHMNLAVREIRRESPFRRKSPAERRLRGALIVSLCLLCGTALYAGSEMTRYMRARGEWDDMAPVRASWETWHEAEERQKDMARGLHAIQQKGGIWEGRLVYLAEAAGGLVELTRLDASDGDVRIKGMAGTEEQAREFGSRLESLWGGRVRMHSIRRNQTGTGITFELSQRGEEANAGTGEEKNIP